VKFRLDQQTEDDVLESTTPSAEGIGIGLSEDPEGFAGLRSSAITDHDEVLIAKVIELPFDLELRQMKLNSRMLPHPIQKTVLQVGNANVEWRQPFD
jgi:hypothetical protein